MTFPIEEKIANGNFETKNNTTSMVRKESALLKITGEN